MNIIKNDKVILVKPNGNLQTVGETYEVANITEEFVVLRDAKTKVAAAAIDLVTFSEYFTKADEFKGWTTWQTLRDETGVLFYRTNGKKTQIKSIDGLRAEACCCKVDNFDLRTGVQIAYCRWNIKMLKELESKHEATLKEIRDKISNNTDIVKDIINRL